VDTFGNLTNVVYPNSGNIGLGYDYANRLTNMVDRVGTTKFSWTAAGQLAGEDGPWDNDAVSYGYTHRLRTSLGLAQPNASAWRQGYSYDDYWRVQTPLRYRQGIGGMSDMAVGPHPLAPAHGTVLWGT
jgi:YD repeat-containing protein